MSVCVCVYHQYIYQQSIFPFNHLPTSPSVLTSIHQFIHAFMHLSSVHPSILSQQNLTKIGIPIVSNTY